MVDFWHAPRVIADAFQLSPQQLARHNACAE